MGECVSLGWGKTSTPYGPHRISKPDAVLEFMAATLEFTAQRRRTVQVQQKRATRRL